MSAIVAALAAILPQLAMVARQLASIVTEFASVAAQFPRRLPGSPVLTQFARVTLRLAAVLPQLATILSDLGPVARAIARGCVGRPRHHDDQSRAHHRQHSISHRPLLAPFGVDAARLVSRIPGCAGAECARLQSWTDATRKGLTARAAQPSHSRSPCNSVTPDSA